MLYQLCAINPSLLNYVMRGAPNRDIVDNLYLAAALSQKLLHNSAYHF